MTTTAKRYESRISKARGSEEIQAIHLELLSRYDRNEPDLENLANRMNSKFGAPAKIDLDQAAAAATNDNTPLDAMARLDRMLRAGLAEDSNKAGILRTIIQDRVTPVIMQAMKEIADDDPRALPAIEEAAAQMNGHPLKEADVCDLMDIPAFAAKAREIEERTRRKIQAGGLEGDYMAVIQKTSTAEALLDLNRRIISDDRINEETRERLQKNLLERSGAVTIEIGHAHKAQAEGKKAFNALCVLFQKNPGVLTVENVEEVFVEILVATRTGQRFSNVKWKNKKAGEALASLEQEFASRVKDAWEEHKEKDPDLTEAKISEKSGGFFHPQGQFGGMDDLKERITRTAAMAKAVKLSKELDTMVAEREAREAKEAKGEVPDVTEMPTTKAEDKPKIKL